MACYDIADEKNILQAENPFDKTQRICGCPTCKSVGVFKSIICDIEEID